MAKQPLSGQNITPGEFVTQYPTPLQTDTQLVTYLESNVDDYLAQVHGAPPPENTHPEQMLVKQTPIDWPLVQRLYAKDRAQELVYNYSISYAEESSGHPIFIRDYIVRRANYVRGTNLAVLPGIYKATVTAGGSGYTQDTVTVTFSGGTGSGGAATAIVSNGVVTNLVITAEGTYTVAPTITISGGAGTGATGTVTIQPATALLVKEDLLRTPESPLDSLYVLVRRVYETLPGVLRESFEWDEEARVHLRTLRQRVASTYTRADLPSVGSTYETGAIIAHNALTGFTVVDPGSGYLSIPTLTAEASPGGGTQATGSVTNLKVVSAEAQNLGTGYLVGDTLTVVGGTGTAATLTVATGELVSLAVNAAGTGYAPTDVVTLNGGVPVNGAATVSVDTTKLVSATINAAGTAMVAGTTVLTLVAVGGTMGTAPTLTVATTKVVSATVAAAGSGGTPGTQTVTGTTGTGTKFQASVTVDGGGTVTAVLSITVAGNYTVNPTVIANEPVTGAGLSGAQLAVVMGALSVAITTAGSFTENSTSFTSTGGGNDATFSAPAFGVNTVSVVSGGGYSTAPTTFTQASVAPVGGLGATFQTALYSAATLTVATGGAYTVIASSPTTVTGGTGSGMTVVLSFGIGAVALGAAGTLYYTNSPAVTLSFGNARVISVSDALAVVASQTAYVIDADLLDTPNSNVKEAVWVTSPKPTTVVYYFYDYVNVPPLLFSISHPYFCNFTSSFTIVSNYVKKGGNASVKLHRATISYSLTEPSVAATFNGWETQDIRYDGKAINFGFNGVLNDAISYSGIFSTSTEGDGCVWEERYDFPATTPSASGFAGQWWTISNKPVGWRGNMFKQPTLEFLG